MLCQWHSSRDYNPAPGLERIEAPLLVIKAADAERKAPETGLTENALKRVRNRKLHLIPPSEKTRGRATTCMAKFYTNELREFLETVPRRTM